ncbi:hypothetical protein WA158_007009 [Blastocystis sp. Blastoise]
MSFDYNNGPAPTTRRRRSRTLEEETGTRYGVPGLGGVISLDDGVKLVICMCGVIGCGKTFIAQKIRRFLNWKGYRCQVFTVNETRKTKFPQYAVVPAEFFDYKNEEALKIREAIEDCTLNDIFRYLNTGGQVAILDNSSVRKVDRDRIEQRILDEPNCHAPLWIEMQLNDPELRRTKFREEKLDSVEYLGLDEEEALQKFEKKAQYYYDVYQSLDNNEEVNRSYCIYDMSEQKRKRFILNNIRGYLATNIISLVINLHPAPHPIYITRHGQTTYNLEDRIGGDSMLSLYGQQYARELAKYISTLEECDPNKLAVWTSKLRRTIQTAEQIECYSRVKWSALNEIDAGICEDLTYAEMGVKYPDLSSQRKKDKLNFRYPQGESYNDLIERLEPVIFELERTTKPTIVVSHQATLRCLLAYFIDKPKEEIPYLPIPLHTLIRITPKANCCEEERFVFLPVDPQTYPPLSLLSKPDTNNNDMNETIEENEEDEEDQNKNQNETHSIEC